MSKINCDLGISQKKVIRQKPDFEQYIKVERVPSTFQVILNRITSNGNSQSFKMKVFQKYHQTKTFQIGQYNIVIKLPRKFYICFATKEVSCDNNDNSRILFLF